MTGFGGKATHNNFMKQTTDTDSDAGRLERLMTFDTLKSDKHMRDAEAFLASNYFLPENKFYQQAKSLGGNATFAQKMQERLSNAKVATYNKTRLDVDPIILVSEDGDRAGVPDSVIRPIEKFSHECDTHYKYALMQILNDMKTKKVITLAEQRIADQIEKLRK